MPSLRSYLAHILTVAPWFVGILTPPLVGLYLVTHLIRLQWPDAWAVALLAALSAQYVLPPRAWPAWRKFIFSLEPTSHFRECTLNVLGTIRAERSMLCYHPHGALSVGFAWNGAHTSKTDVYKVTWLVVDILPKLPIMGYVVNWFGNMRGVSPPVMRRFLESGRNVGLIPGGFEEATIMKRGVERVYLRRRKGFVKYALRYGYNLHPAYTFGESDTYLTFHWFVKARLALNRFKLPAIAVFGDPLFPLFPRPDTRINTFVGDALVLPHLPEPTDAQVDEWHTRYIEALQALFDSKKAAVGKPEAVLEIW